MSTESLRAPVALVTGADKGIGLETARHLAGAGYRVYSPHAAVRGQAAVATAGAQLLELDVTSDQSVRHAAKSVEQAGGHLDVLVDNAGITGPVRDDPHDYTADDMTKVLLTNVVGYIRVIHAFLPLLERVTTRGSSMSAAGSDRSRVSTTAVARARSRARRSTPRRRPRST